MSGKPYRYGGTPCAKCGRDYDGHLADRPLHVYQGFVWMPPSVPWPTRRPDPQETP